MILKKAKISGAWHIWFAWYPVPVNQDGDRAFFRFVERCKAPGAAGDRHRIDYRIPGKDFFAPTKAKAQ